MLRVGIGNDIHRLVKGRKLYIGGIEIPSERGEEAHSDGDILIHAIIDALLGSSALGDIGTHFPDSNEEYKNASSKDLLREALKLTKAEIINIDTIVEVENVILKDHIQSIRESLSDILSLDICRISVKAKTNEKLGPVGQAQAIKATAVVLAEY